MIALLDWQLAEPGWLLLLLLAPACLLWRARRRRTAPGMPFGKGLPITLRQRLEPLAPLLQVLGISAWAVALARPVEMRSFPAEAPGIDILLCLDRSSSMAREVATGRSRLVALQAAARGFAIDRTDDRIGLLTFARYPDLLTPPTTDRDALLALLGTLTPEDQDSAEDMTGIGAAVARGAQVLARSGASTRVLVLWTDGEENVATRATPDEIPPAAAAQLCRRLGVRVHVVTAGQPEDPAAPGRMAMADLAGVTGGQLLPVADGDRAEAVFAEIDRLERAPLPRPRVEAVERALPVLLLGVAMWLLGGLLRRTALEVLP